jgi:hypothetical protein
MPNSITRSQIRQWARSGNLTPERIAAIEAAHRTGQVVRDGGGVDPVQPVPLDPPPPMVAGTEIAAQKTVVRLPWWW